MMTENDALMEIVHLASAAIVADKAEVKRQTLADIADAIAAIVPVEGKKIGGEDAAETGGTRSVASAGAPQGMAAFLRISDRLQLIRFRGKDVVQLVGRVKGVNGTPNQVFEIHVNKDDRTAVVYRDEKPLWTIQGSGRVNSGLIEQLAVSTLHRWWKSTRRATKRSHKKVGGEDAPRIAPASQLASLGGYAETGRGNPDYKKFILSTHEELARTVAEQKEVK